MKNNLNFGSALNGIPNINIAKQFGAFRKAVSRAYLSMDKSIEKMLLEMAK